MERTQRIVIVEDHPLRRAALRASPAEDPSFEVVAGAGSDFDAIRRAGELATHSAPMDRSMAVTGVGRELA
jgi:DNA-binding NarL/FixJ family response regulator